MLTLVDGYAVSDDDPDYIIQLRIDEYLSGPANLRTFGSTAGHVLRDAGSAQQEYQWLVPMLRRIEWLLEHPENARPHWAMHLMAAVRFLLNHNREQTEQELLTLLGYASVFRRLEKVGGMDEIPPRVVQAFRKTTNKQVWTAALESACFELEQFSTVQRGRFAAELGMALMTDPAAPASSSPCWSAPVAADLREMAAQGTAWRSLFALADTQFMYPEEPNAKKVAAALKKIGPDTFAARLDAWTAPMEGQEVYLSWRGVAVLKILLQGAISAPIPGVQPPLTRIAGARWRQPDRARLTDDLIVAAIVAQPGSFARTCLETLAAQPHAVANTALKVALATPEKKESPLGIDGYPLDERPEHALLQRRLDEWLRRPGDFMTGNQSQPDLRSLALRGDEPDYPGLLASVLERIDWVHKHRALIPQHFYMTQALTRYLPDLQRLVNQVDRDSLLRLMKAAADRAVYCSQGGEILETVERYVAMHGFDVELVTAIDGWHKATHGSVTDQTLRKHLGWLLWREDAMPVKMNVCWSSLIRQDVRDMPAALGKKWRDMLTPMTFHLSSSPPAKWKKETAPFLKALGHAEFTNGIRRWFKPFAEGKPLPLEATGSHVLRSLMWHCAEVEDAGAGEALSWYAKATWKSKKCKSFTSKLLGPLLYALGKKPAALAHACLEMLVEKGEILEGTKEFEIYLAHCDRLAVPRKQGAAAQTRPAPEDPAIRALKKMGCEVTDDSVVVKGQIDTYIVDRRSREIRRLRDGVLLNIDTGGENTMESEALARMFQLALGRDNNQGLLALAQTLMMDHLLGRFLKKSEAGSRVQ